MHRTAKAHIAIRSLGSAAVSRDNHKRRQPVSGRSHSCANIPIQHEQRVRLTAKGRLNLNELNGVQLAERLEEEAAPLAPPISGETDAPFFQA
jgi:hypothetical protein